MKRSAIPTFAMTAQRRSSRLRLFLPFAALLFLSACSFPRIIVLHDPLSSDEHVRLGGIYAAQGETAHARDQYRMAVEADKKNGKAWQLLGDLSYELKDYREAERAYDEALDLAPSSGDLMNNLAWVYVQEGKKLGKAKDLAEKAMQAEPDHRPYYLDTLGVVLLKMGRPQESIAALKESIAAFPKDQANMLADAWLHLSEACRAAGDAAGADNALDRSKELRPKP